MKKQSDKGPVVARGAKSRGRCAEMLETVLVGIAEEARANVPPEFLDEVVSIAEEFGEPAAIQFAGQFARSFFSRQAMRDGYLAGAEMVRGGVAAAKKFMAEANRGG